MEWVGGIIGLGLGPMGWWQVAVLSGLIYLRASLFGAPDRPLPQWPRLTWSPAEMKQICILIASCVTLNQLNMLSFLSQNKA